MDFYFIQNPIPEFCYALKAHFMLDTSIVTNVSNENVNVNIATLKI